jgi:hypothetical protein
MNDVLFGGVSAFKNLAITAEFGEGGLECAILLLACGWWIQLLCTLLCWTLSPAFQCRPCHASASAANPPQLGDRDDSPAETVLKYSLKRLAVQHVC